FNTAGVVEAPPPAATDAYETIFERRRTPREQVQDVLRAYSNPLYRPLRRGEFYAAGFLTENERLPWGRVLGNTATPAIPRLTERSTATRFDQIALAPPRNASYHVGDSLLIARIDRDITGWGGVVVPVGVARVTELQRKQVLADVIMQFGRIHDGHLAIPQDALLTRRRLLAGAGAMRLWFSYRISWRSGCTAWPRRLPLRRSRDFGPHRAP